MRWCSSSFGSKGSTGTTTTSSSSSSSSRTSAVQTAQLCLIAVMVVAVSLVRISTDTLFQLAKDDAVKQEHLSLQITSNTKSATPRQQLELELDESSRVSAVTTTMLRYDWTSLKRLSPLAQRLALHQHNCLLPFVKYEHSMSTGLGSGLHVHSAYLCHAVQEGQVRLKSTFPWIWLDLPTCALEANVTVELYRKGYTETGSSSLRRRTSAMSCYFSDTEPSCPQDELLTATQDARIAVYPNQGNDDRSSNCDTLANNEFGKEGGISQVRAAATEFYFTRVSPLLQREAERHFLQLLFGNNKTPDRYSAAVVPPNLITVHMRWGDKGSEMVLQSADKYVAAVHNLLAQRRNHSTNDVRYWNDSYSGVNIYLSTVDLNARQAFITAAPSNWTIFVDDFFVQPGYTDVVPMMAETSSSSTGPGTVNRTTGTSGVGLVTLALLLVSMEANTFVLTTASNWSRLMNELRKNVLDPRCNNCTLMVDLISDEW